MAKVFLTTHSDYIIKELNTLIMLHQPSEKIPDILAKLPDYSAEDKLNPASVALYMAREESRVRPGGKRNQDDDANACRHQPNIGYRFT